VPPTGFLAGRVVDAEIQAPIQFANIVVVGIRRTGFKASQLVPRLREKGVLVGTVNETTLRLLTHVDVCGSDMGRAARVFAEVLSRSDS
jgi:threonine aldolase